MLKFREWLALREDNWDWGGADFIGWGTNPNVNNPDYYYNSKYQGKGIRWDEPSDLSKIKKKYGKKTRYDDKSKPIEDRVPEQGKKEKDKEEREGGDGENQGSLFIRGESDPMSVNSGSFRRVEKMYKLTPSYELKKMKKA